MAYNMLGIQTVSQVLSPGLGQLQLKCSQEERNGARRPASLACDFRELFPDNAELDEQMI